MPVWALPFKNSAFLTFLYVPCVSVQSFIQFTLLQYKFYQRFSLCWQRQFTCSAVVTGLPLSAAAIGDARKNEGQVQKQIHFIKNTEYSGLIVLKNHSWLGNYKQKK